MSINTQTITYVDIIRPSKRLYAIAYDLFLVVAGSILLALSAKVSFYIPFSPVPVTGQTFAVLFLGALYGSKRGALTVIAYIAEGVSGLPVFVSGAGIAYLFGPTGGYLFGFITGAFLTGFFAERGWDRKVLTTVAAMTVGFASIFLFGVTWLSFFVGQKALMLGLVPFIPGEIIKIALAAALLPSGWKILNRLK